MACFLILKRDTFLKQLLPLETEHMDGLISVEVKQTRRKRNNSMNSALSKYVLNSIVDQLLGLVNQVRSFVHFFFVVNPAPALNLKKIISPSPTT